MNPGTLPSIASAHGPVTARHCLTLFLVALVLACLLDYLGARALGSDLPLEQQFSYRLSSYANLLLLGSTVLYLAHLRYKSEAVGLWASGLGLAGALGLLVGVLAHGTESYVLHRVDHAPLTSLHELMGLFSAFTVLIYLLMERSYRSRSAGAFVMPLVAAAVLFGAWLAAKEQPGVAGAVPVLRGYALRAHVLSNFIGYGAFAVAAALAACALLRERAERRGGAGVLSLGALIFLGRSERLMMLSVGLGFAMFSMAALLGAHSAHTLWGRYWDGSAKESWTLLVWSHYGAVLFLHRHGRVGARAAAWAVLAGFGLTAFGFLGLQWLVGGWHAYA